MDTVSLSPLAPSAAAGSVASGEERRLSWPATLCSVIGAAIVYTLAFPPFDLSVAAWLAPGLLLAPMRGLSARAAIGCGFLFAVTMSIGVAHWVATATLAYFGSNPVLAGLFALAVYVIYGGLPYASLTCAYAVVSRRLPLAARAPLAAWLWVASELLRANLFTGLPWALLGHSQSRHTALIQIADLGGVYAVSFVMVLCSVAAAEVLATPGRGMQRRAWVRPFALPVAAVAATLLYGVLCLDVYDRPPPAGELRRVAIVQGNVPNAFRWKREQLERSVGTYLGMTRSLAAQHADLVVWPENAVSFFLNREPTLQFAVAAAARSAGAGLLLGAPRLGPDGEAFNSAYLLDADGRVAATYDKRRLVPFAEYHPLSVFGRGAATEPVEYRAGTSAEPLDAGSLRIGTVICYEVLFPNLVRDLVRRGATVLVNLSNDSWLDRGDGVAPRQHFMMAIFRAVEARRYLVRASASGVSGFVSPSGTVTSTLPSDTAGTAVAAIRPLEGQTPYVRFGDGWILIGGLFIGAGLLARRRVGPA